MSIIISEVQGGGNRHFFRITMSFSDIIFIFRPCGNFDLRMCFWSTTLFHRYTFFFSQQHLCSCVSLFSYFNHFAYFFFFCGLDSSVQKSIKATKGTDVCPFHSSKIVSLETTLRFCRALISPDPHYHRRRPSKQAERSLPSLLLVVTIRFELNTQLLPSGAHFVKAPV